MDATKLKIKKNSPPLAVVGLLLCSGLAGSRLREALRSDPSGGSTRRRRLPPPTPGVRDLGTAARRHGGGQRPHRHARGPHGNRTTHPRRSPPFVAFTDPLTMASQLTSLGIAPQFVTFTHVTMESEKYICVRETSPQNSVVIIDMAMPMQPLRRPITADSALMNPNTRILALKGLLPPTALLDLPIHRAGSHLIILVKSLLNSRLLGSLRIGQRSQLLLLPF